MKSLWESHSIPLSPLNPYENPMKSPRNKSLFITTIRSWYFDAPRISTVGFSQNPGGALGQGERNLGNYGILSMEFRWVKSWDVWLEIPRENGDLPRENGDLPKGKWWLN